MTELSFFVYRKRLRDLLLTLGAIIMPFTPHPGHADRIQGNFPIRLVQERGSGAYYLGQGNPCRHVDQRPPPRYLAGMLSLGKRYWLKARLLMYQQLLSDATFQRACAAKTSNDVKNRVYVANTAIQVC